jgi:hypothetical protein
MPFNLPINPSDVASLVTIGVNDSGSGTNGSSVVNNVSPQIDAKIYIGGKVTNEKGEILSNVNITFTQTPKVDVEDLGIIKPIVKNVTTDNNGEWALIFPKTEIDVKSIDILYVKQDYKPEQISLASFTSIEYPDEVSEPKKISTPDTEPPYIYIVGNKQFSNNKQNIAQSRASDYYNKARDPKYKGAVIYNINKTLFLSPTPEEVTQAAIQTYVQPITNEINELERVQNEEKAKEDLPPQAKVIITIDVQKEEIKKILIPYIIKLLIPFGIIAVQAVVSKIDLEKIKDQILCPRQDKILELINKRNKLVRKINSIYKTITSISRILVGVNTAITAIQVGILAITVVPFPAPAGVTSALGDLKDELKKAQIVVNIITLALAAFGAVLGIILRLLNALDILIRECAQSQNIPFETINTELNIFINQSTGINNSAVIASDNTYKGFKLEIKLDETNSIKYPRRYAQALTKTGIPVLKTDSSFASDPQVLLDQLKFIIDSNPQLTAE